MRTDASRASLCHWNRASKFASSTPKAPMNKPVPSFGSGSSAKAKRKSAWNFQSPPRDSGESPSHLRIGTRPTESSQPLPKCRSLRHRSESRSPGSRFEFNCEASRSSSLRFDLLYGAPQPIPHRIFDLFLRSAAVEILQCLPFLCERDVAARNLCSTLVRWNQLHQHAFFTRRWILLRIVVHAAG